MEEMQTDEEKLIVDIEPSKYVMTELFRKNDAELDDDLEKFDLVNERTLAIKLDGKIYMKMSSMVAYTGEIKFTRTGIAEHGVGRALKKAFTSEGLKITRAEGVGKLFLADNGKKVRIIKLNDESVVINGGNVLAFEEQIEWDISLMKKVGAIIQGGLFNMKLSGTGYVAVTTHFDPISIRVEDGSVIRTDPSATVLWSANFKPKLHVDVALKSFIGLTSGESLQMVFRSDEDGDGYVIVNPYHHVPGTQQ